jgi:hypothetical protein
MDDSSSTTGLPATSELVVVVYVDSKKLDSLDTSLQTKIVWICMSLPAVIFNAYLYLICSLFAFLSLC